MQKNAKIDDFGLPKWSPNRSFFVYFWETSIFQKSTFVKNMRKKSHFESILGGQNHRFSHFFRYFLEVNFEVRFGRRKNPPKSRKKAKFSAFWSRGCGVHPPPGKRFRDGNKNFQGHHFETCQIKVRNLVKVPRFALTSSTLRSPNGEAAD